MKAKLVMQYYVLSALFSMCGLSIISAIYVTFLIKNGLNLFQVNLVNTAFFLTLFICEIPTGAFADIFGRKKSFVIACGMLALGSFVYAFSHSFFGFVAAEIISGIACTFRSGAFQAWFVDSLKHHGHEGEYTKIFARENLIRQITGGIGAVGGSYLSAHNPALPWLASGIAMTVITFIAAITMKEEYFVKGTFSWKQGLASMRNVAVSSIHYGKNHKAVRFILIITGIQIFSVQAVNMYWQPFFRDRHVNEQHLGFLFTAMMVALATGSFLTSRSNCEGKEKKLILKMQIYAGILVIVATLVPNTSMAVIVFVIHEVPRGAFSPLIDSYLQKRIPSSERATIASFCAIAPHIGGAIGLVVSGGIAQLFGISTAWIIAGVSLIIGALLVAKNNNHDSD